MRSFSRAGILAFCVVSFAAAALAQSTTPKTSLLVLSKHDHTLAIVDPASLRAVARVPVGDDPHEVIASADGHTAYVSNCRRWFRGGGGYEDAGGSREGGRGGEPARAGLGGEAVRG